jgi:hypothetical protein
MSKPSKQVNRKFGRTGRAISVIKGLWKFQHVDAFHIHIHKLYVGLIMRLFTVYGGLEAGRRTQTHGHN